MSVDDDGGVALVPERVPDAIPPEPEPEPEPELEPEPDPDPAALPKKIPVPEPAQVRVPEPIRVPAPATRTEPAPEQVAGLLGYVRGLAGSISVNSELSRGSHEDVATLAEQYLDPASYRRVQLDLHPVRRSRGGAYYGRVDIVVSAPEPFFEVVPEITVRGPMVYSELSFLDAELASLFAFPLRALRRAGDRITCEMELLVRDRGLPYRVVSETPHAAADRRWLHAVFASQGRAARDDGVPVGAPGDRADLWWLFLPPRELEAYIRSFLADDSWTVVVEPETLTVRVERKTL